MSDDLFMNWLVERKAIISKIEDKIIRDIMSAVHDDYVENYIIFKKV